MHPTLLSKLQWYEEAIVASLYADFYHMIYYLTEKADDLQYQSWTTGNGLSNFFYKNQKFIKKIRF